MEKVFLALLILFSTITYSAHITVGPSGCDYTDLNAAINKHVAYDIIEIKNGPKLYVLQSRLILKKGVILKSTSLTKDTIEGVFGSYGTIEFSGDSVTLDNLYIRFSMYKGTQSNGLLVLSRDFGGHKLINCYFQQNGDGPNGNYRRGICLERANAGVVTEPTLIRHCVFDSLCHSGGIYNTFDKLATHVTIDSCLIVGDGGSFGSNYTIRNNIYLFGAGLSGREIAVSGDSILIEYNYFNGRGTEGEMITWDDQKTFSKNCIFRYNVMDSVAHMAVCHDGVENFKAEYNNIIIPYNKEIPAFGSHAENEFDKCKNVRISNNTIGCKPLMMRGENVSHEDVSFVRNIATGDGFDKAGQTWSVNVESDTIGMCVYVQDVLPAPSIDDNFDSVGIIIKGVPKNSLFIDTTQKYPYLKRNSKAFFQSDNTFAGCRKYLVNIIEKKFDNATATLKVRYNIDSLFWYNDPIGKDSGIVTLQTLKDNVWKSHQNSGLQKAGYNGVLTATGVSATDQCRLIFQGTPKTGRLADTSEIALMTIIPLKTAPNAYQAKDLICVNLENSVELNLLSKNDGVANVMVYDLSGKVFLNKQLTISAGSNRFEIGKKGISNGIYTLVIEHSNLKVVKKVNIAH